MRSLATSVAPVTNSDVFMSCGVEYIFVLSVVGAQEAMRFLDDYEIRVWHVEISLVRVTAKPGSTISFQFTWRRLTSLTLIRTAVSRIF